MIKLCAICATDYHVSRYDTQNPYICPVCAGKYVVEDRPKKRRRKRKKRKTATQRALYDGQGDHFKPDHLHYKTQWRFLQCRKNMN